MVNKQFKVAFLLVLASFFIHLYLMNTHYDFKYGYSNAKSICTISETLNCESVSISKYSYLLGLPMATWGLTFHIGFLFIFLLAWANPESTTSSLRVLRIFALLSLVTSLVMAAISLTSMSAYCIFCMTLYALSVIIFALLFMNAKKPLFPLKMDLTKNVLISFALIPVLAFLIHDMTTRSYGNKNKYLTSDAFADWEKAPVQSFGTPLLSMGNAQSASMKIVEFADFQCVHCKDSAHGLESFVRSKPDVYFEFYVFPLDGACNSAISQSNGKSCMLSKAVYCAEKQKMGWKAHAWIFNRFGSDDNSKFEEMSKDLNLNFAELSQCLQSDEATQFVTEQAQLGQKLKIEGTPAVFVNGKKLSLGNMVFVLESFYRKLHP